jgi:hypothetical protein
MDSWRDSYAVRCVVVPEISFQFIYPCGAGLCTYPGASLRPSCMGGHYLSRLIRAASAAVAAAFGLYLGHVLPSKWGGESMQRCGHSDTDHNQVAWAFAGVSSCKISLLLPKLAASLESSSRAEQHTSRHVAAEAVKTPRSSCLRVRAIALAAPRILSEPIG